MKHLDVQILGQSYMLTCPPEAQDQLMAAVAKVHEAMTKIQDAGKIKARERIAVLAALNIAYDLPTGNPTNTTMGSPHIAASDDARPLDEATAQKIESLIHRLDEALHFDGKLL